MFIVWKQTFILLWILALWLGKATLIPLLQKIGAPDWPQLHQYFFIIILARSSYYAEVDILK